MADHINKIKNAICPVLKDAGVVRSSLFGSHARGDFNSASDIDILVELPDGSTLIDLVRLETKLKNILNHDVDLLTYDSIHPLLKNQILDTQIQIL